MIKERENLAGVYAEPLFFPVAIVMFGIFVSYSSKLSHTMSLGDLSVQED